VSTRIHPPPPPHTHTHVHTHVRTRAQTPNTQCLPHCTSLITSLLSSLSSLLSLSLPLPLNQVLPPLAKEGIVGIGFIGQLGKGDYSRILSVTSNGSVTIQNFLGRAASTHDGWYRLGLNVSENGDFLAFVDGTLAVNGSLGKPDGWFPSLVASYSGEDVATGNAEFRNLFIEVVPLPTTPPPPPPPQPPSPPPGPAPPGPPAPHRGAGLALVACTNGDPRQLWVFSGEDAGEPGTLRPSSNLSRCLDSQNAVLRPSQLVECSTPRQDDIQFTWSSTSGAFSGVETRACQVSSHGKTCHFCLDAEKQAGGPAVGLFDCKPHDSNQVWKFDASAGGAPIRWKANTNLCVGSY
jgi:hypothetical protein